MNYQAFVVGLGLSLGVVGAAAVPAPDRLLPADTLILATVPDWDAATTGWNQHPLNQFWHDPAMNPFRERLTDAVRGELIAPLQEQMGVRLGELTGLVRGQLTLALVQNGWPTRTGSRPALVVLADTADQAERVGELLDGWRERLAEAGNPVKPERIGDRDFFSVRLSADTVGVTTGTLVPDAVQMIIGRSDTLFVMGTERDVIEQVVARQSGTGTAGSSLGDLRLFRQDYEAGLRGSHGYGWVNLQPILNYVRQWAQAQAEQGEGVLALFQPAKLMSAMGIDGLRSLGLGAQFAADGSQLELLVGLPESERAGLMKLLVPEAKPAGPPAFVPADVARFQRMRLDLAQAWNAFEETVFTVLPAARGVVDMMLFSVGKDQDPDFDVRRELFGNLDDDVIVIERAPSEQTLATLGSPPTLILLGSRAPDRVAVALKALAGLLPPPLNQLQERVVDGHRVYELHLPQTSNGAESVPMLGFLGGDGYLALSTEPDLLAEFARGRTAQRSQLSDRSGLSEAAARVGGTGNGLFGYENDRLNARTMLEALRNDAGLIEQMLDLTPLGAQLDDRGEGRSLRDWLDFSQLPTFDRVEQYFDFSVYGVAVRPEGFSYRMFTPRPR